MIKRSFDFFASLVGLILISPILLVIALLIKVLMPGPVFFCQKRAGRYGVPFTIIKFRTMTVAHEGNSISVKGEKRITKIGAILRRYKLDELPELWNVLVGDMSLVGPRPDVPEYAAKLKGEESLILNLRPGITGPATLKYSREEELLSSFEDPKKYNDEVLWPDKVSMNLSYYYNRSFFTDLRIIFRTLLPHR